MARNNEISSTEKLLRVIRGDQNELPDVDPLDQAVDYEREGRSYLDRNIIPFSKSVSVGVILGHQDLTLVMLSRTGENTWKLLDYQKVPFEKGVGKESPQFPVFLRNTMDRFCGSHRNAEIWSTVPSARVEIRYLKIPKVPDKQIPNAAYWTYKKQVPFIESESIFDFQLLGESSDGGSKKMALVAYAAPEKEIAEHRDLFTSIGYPLKGISIVPFAFQNLFRTGLMDRDTPHVCSLYIGQDWSRIDIFSNGNLVLSRDIKTGMNSFFEAIRAGQPNEETQQPLAAEYDEEPLQIVGEENSQASENVEEARERFFRFIDLSLPEDRDHDETKELILPVLERLVRQLERTLGHFTLHFENTVVSKIYIAGDIGGQNRLVQMISEQLGHTISQIDPFESPDLDTTQTSTPESAAERDALSPALGIAVSDNSLTPNFIYTFRQKAVFTKIRKINRSVFIVFMILAVLCGMVFLWLDVRIDMKKAEVASLVGRLNRYSPHIDRKLIEEMVAKLNMDRKAMQQYARSYLGMAVLTELAELTPENIRLTEVKAEFGSDEKKQPNGKNLLIIEGISSGDASARESNLAVYMLKLNGSPLFNGSNVLTKTVQIVNEQEVLRFKARLEIL